MENHFGRYSGIPILIRKRYPTVDAHVETFFEELWSLSIEYAPHNTLRYWNVGPLWHMEGVEVLFEPKCTTEESEVKYYFKRVWSFIDITKKSILDNVNKS